MRRVFWAFTERCCEDLRIRATKRSFQSLVRNNGKDNLMIIWYRFPADAKVVEIMHNYARAMLYVVIESKEYPDVRAPTEIHPVITTLPKGKEVVEFS